MNIELFVQNIKYFSRKKGEPTTTVCKNAGVGASFVSDLLRGRAPSVKKVQMLANYLEVTTSDLLGEKEKPTPLWGSGLSDEALEVAAAYDQAAKKDQDTVRFILADYLPRAAAARGDIDLSREDLSGVTVAGEDHELP